MAWDPIREGIAAQEGRGRIEKIRLEIAEEEDERRLRELQREVAKEEAEKRLRELQCEDDHDEDAERGRKVLDSASKGGLALRNEDRDQAIAEAVTHLHESRPHLSWTEVGKRVGNEHDLSGQQVRNIAKKAGVEPWRLPE